MKEKTAEWQEWDQLMKALQRESTDCSRHGAKAKAVYASLTASIKAARAARDACT